MSIELDKNGNKYQVEQMKILHKICPITGELGKYSECDCYDCSKVRPDITETLYGQTYHCKAERDIIQRNYESELERRLERLKAYQRRLSSLEAARTIDLNDFFSFCDSIDRYLHLNKQIYSRGMTFKPYRESDEIFLVYWLEKDEVEEICTTENLFQNISNHFTKLRENPDYSVGYRRIPMYVAEAVKVNLCLRYRIDTKSMIHYENPVYIKARNLAKYLESAYGMSWHDFNKIRKNSLGLTEIANFDNVILIKQEIDDLIKKETILQKK